MGSPRLRGIARRIYVIGVVVTELRVPVGGIGVGVHNAVVSVGAQMAPDVGMASINRGQVELVSKLVGGGVRIHGCRRAGVVILDGLKIGSLVVVGFARGT